MRKRMRGTFTAKLASGVLPSTLPTPIVRSMGSGLRCAACDVSIRETAVHAVIHRSSTAYPPPTPPVDADGLRGTTRRKPWQKKRTVTIA